MPFLKNIITTKQLLQVTTYKTVSNFQQQQNVGSIIQRNIWGHVAIAFNRVDPERLKLVGPNRLCAEWVLKNGGAVRMTDHPTRLWKVYNSLPPESNKFKIKEVDASNASVMKIGLEHFAGCTNIDTVIFHNCKHLEDDGLDGLLHLTNSLTNLQVSGCYNIKDDGMMVIGKLKNLKILRVFDMIYVKDLENVAKYLATKLPQCEIRI